jgi:rhodanese-related sulfurtransferase
MSDAPDLILDVRSPSEFCERHVEGAINVPLGEIEERADELPPATDAPRILVYCASGVRACKAVKILREHGYGHAYIGHKNMGRSCACQPCGRPGMAWGWGAPVLACVAGREEPASPLLYVALALGVGALAAGAAAYKAHRRVEHRIDLLHEMLRDAALVARLGV